MRNYFLMSRVSVFQDRKVLDINGSDNCVTKNLILTLVKMVRKTSFVIIAIGVKTITIGAKITAIGARDQTQL